MVRLLEVLLTEFTSSTIPNTLAMNLQCLQLVQFSDTSNDTTAEAVDDDTSLTSDGTASITTITNIVKMAMPSLKYYCLCPEGIYTTLFLDMKYLYVIEEYTSKTVDRLNKNLRTRPDQGVGDLISFTVDITQFMLHNSSMMHFRPFSNEELDHFVNVEGHSEILHNAGGVTYDWGLWDRLILATPEGHPIDTWAPYLHYIHYPTSNFTDIDKFHIHRVQTGRIYEYATRDYIKAYNEYRLLAKH